MVSTYLKKMLVKLEHLPRDRGEKSQNLWNENQHLVLGVPRAPHFTTDNLGIPFQTSWGKLHSPSLFVGLAIVSLCYVMFPRVDGWNRFSSNNITWSCLAMVASKQLNTFISQTHAVFLLIRTKITSSLKHTSNPVVIFGLTILPVGLMRDSLIWANNFCLTDLQSLK